MVPVVWIFISLQLMLLATSLNARRCVRPTSTSVAPGTTSKPTSTTPNPTDDDSMETSLGTTDTSTPGPTDDDPTDASSDPSGETTDAPSDPSEETTEAPSDPSGETTGSPSDPSGETTDAPSGPSGETTGSPSDPSGETTDAPSDPSGETTGSFSDPSEETTIAQSDPSDESTDTPPTTKAPPNIDATAVCQAYPTAHYLQYPYDCHMFIQCDVALLAVVTLTTVAVLVGAADPECVYRKLRGLSPHWPNPTSCSSYYRCSAKGTVRALTCPAGKEYNPKNGKCATAGRGLCKLSFVAPLSVATNVCTDEVTGAFLPKSGFCGEYYICDDQQAYAQKCSAGSVFNNTLRSLHSGY
ncbi:GL25112 [Drosophila persimilis]|uniref:GL25112 n=1 Tax=Drosophila persimilis TaxID=7234 RepID=B4GQX7_DROPE|nr:GL25112 [Drosophila persimilis]